MSDSPSEQLAAPPKKFKPDVLLDFHPARLKTIQALARQSFEVQARKLKKSNGANDVLELELLLTCQLLELLNVVHRTCQNNPSQKPIMAQMIDRFQVLGTQMEELFIHEREIIDDIQEEHGDNVVFFTPDNIPEPVADIIAEHEGEPGLQRMAPESQDRQSTEDQQL